jgi:hypothetical protein
LGELGPGPFCEINISMLISMLISTRDVTTDRVHIWTECECESTGHFFQSDSPAANKPGNRFPTDPSSHAFSKTGRRSVTDHVLMLSALRRSEDLIHAVVHAFLFLFLMLGIRSLISTLLSYTTISMRFEY